MRNLCGFFRTCVSIPWIGSNLFKSKWRRGYRVRYLRFQSPGSGQICLKCTAISFKDLAGKLVSIPWIGSNLFKIYLNLMKRLKRTVSIPWIGSNLFKVKQAGSTTCYCNKPFQSPGSGQICLNTSPLYGFRTRQLFGFNPLDRVKFV